MPYTYKNDKPVNTEMFKFPDEYGRTVNLQNESMRAELENYQREIGEKVDFALGDSKFLIFETFICEKYAYEFQKFIESYGGNDLAITSFISASKPSMLLLLVNCISKEHAGQIFDVACKDWMKDVYNKGFDEYNKKRETKNEKNTVSKAVSA